MLVNTIKHLKNKNQLLIIPLTMYSGFEQAYIGADFTKVKINYVLKFAKILKIFFKNYPSESEVIH